MDENFRHCAALVRAADKDRFLATLFAPAEKRGPLLALHAFDIEIASVRDRAREPMPGEIRLQWWRDVLNGERAGGAAANPIAAALAETIARFNLPVLPLLDLIEARAFDLYDDPMLTLGALEGYGRKTEGAVIQQLVRVMSSNDDASVLAAGHAGIATSITSILRSVARHASRQQVYLPLDLLEPHGARVEDIYAGQATPALSRALVDLQAVARRHLAAFEALLPELSAAAAPAFLTTAPIPGYLAAMERPEYDPFRSAAEVPQWRRQWALWRAARRWSRMMLG